METKEHKMKIEIHDKRHWVRRKGDKMIGKKRTIHRLTGFTLFYAQCITNHCIAGETVKHYNLVLD